MELNILPILRYEGKSLPLSEALTVVPRQGDPFNMLSPISLEGAITNVGGCLELEAEGKVKLSMVCDRCAAEFETEFTFEVSERFKKPEVTDGEEQNPDLILIEGDTIDLDEVAYDAMALNLPLKILCREDCQGLCANCGQNLNVASCNCEKETTDPRFDILDQLL